MDLRAQRTLFDQEVRIYERARLTFKGVEGFDVYNPSIPFVWEGQRYIFGRVERRAEWARSWVRLFAETGPDEWALVPDAMVYPLEDPYVARIGGELVLGGTHVRRRGGAIDTYYGYFYRGRDLHDLRYFTTGPDYMKDIRLVQIEDGRIGVFSRPRNQEILATFGCESQVGFTVIDSLDQLTAEVIAAAPYIPGLFGPGDWGGGNQAYLLEDGMIGVIGHQSYNTADAAEVKQEVHTGALAARQPHEQPVAGQTYLNIAFVFDRQRHEVVEKKIIGTRSSYPAGPAKLPHLADVAFTAGIVMRPDGRTDLYSGLGDTEAGRIVIDYPFEGHGRIR